MKVSGRGTVESLEKHKPKGKCRRWRLWVRAEGKTRSRRFTGTYTEAHAALDAFRAELEREVAVSESFATYAQGWLEHRKRSGSYDPNTLAKDARNVRALCRVLGDMATSAIGPAECRHALERIRGGENASGRELAGTTMQSMHVCLHQIMEQAADDGLIATNPMRKVKAPKTDTPEKRALSADEIDALLDALDEMPLDGRVMAVYLMACLGLRRGEACGLMDADVADGLVHVRYAVKEASGTIGRPKSKAGTRTLPMPGRLEEKVDEWRVVREERGYGDAPTLACSTIGTVLHPQNLYKWWCKNAAALGTEGLTMHELRHSNLTLVARHLSPFDLQRYAGWSSLEPAQIYIHEDIDALTRGIQAAWSASSQGAVSPFLHQKTKQARRTSA